MSRQQQRRERRREQQREHDRQRERQAEQRTLQQAFNADGQLDRGWMREILDTDDLENHLQPYSLKKIDALLNKQWVLANLTDAETHDRVYKLEVMKYKLIGEHPPSESEIKGPLRAVLFNDENEQLQPLTPAERNTIDQIVTTLQNMVSRSRGGFERKQMNTRIGRTETESHKDDSGGGGLSGLFS